jgi:hypothetical protein
MMHQLGYDGYPDSPLYDFRKTLHAAIYSTFFAYLCLVDAVFRRLE